MAGRGTNKIPRVWTVSEFYKNKAVEFVWRAFLGVGMLKIRGIYNSLEQRKAQNAVSVYPQVLATFMGADGCSFGVFIVASLPNYVLQTTKDTVLGTGSLCYHARSR